MFNEKVSFELYGIVLNGTIRIVRRLPGYTCSSAGPT